MITVCENEIFEYIYLKFQNGRMNISVIFDTNESLILCRAQRVGRVLQRTNDP